MVWNQQFLVRPAGSFENSISPSYVDETHLGDEHDKFMGINRILWDPGTHQFVGDF